MSTAYMPPVYEGEADFHYPAAGKPLKTWYKITGDLKNSKATPLIILHGGPGVGSVAYNSLADLTVAYSIPIIQYDQVGCGHSTHLRDKTPVDAEFWNDSLFVAELESLIAHLGLTQFDVLGDCKGPCPLLSAAWGAMFGSRFAAKQPKGLRKYVIMSSAPSMFLWVEAQNDLRRTEKCEKEEKTNSEEYQSAMTLYYSKFLCRLNPMPEEILASFALLKNDPTVYSKMLGPSEFFITGTLKDWSVIEEELHKITVPTLLLNGRHDEAQDSAMIEFFTRLHNVKWVQFAESSHMAQYEERASCIDR
ncbi:proline-specific peptidase [Gymnopilus junonius]|uniref:Proline-specific peptidase n=1 Tax=Gymnopilus junonius TaxID=109634 RepID=A0A9P5TN47_GYMJU|nr:proline-specific peptidase [Gymnopilus junonius]